MVPGGSCSGYLAHTGAGQLTGQYVCGSPILRGGCSDFVCIGEAEPYVVVPVVRAIVVAIGATQVGWFVVPGAAPLNPVRALMPAALGVNLVASPGRALVVTNNYSCFVGKHLH